MKESLYNSWIIKENPEDNADGIFEIFIGQILEDILNGVLGRISKKKHTVICAIILYQELCFIENEKTNYGAFLNKKV